MTIITLTTDFGLADGYVGIMHGVILSIAPEARLVDLSHAVAPQNIRQAAYILQRAWPYFPAGTVHLAVVDPGVGGARRAIAVRAGGMAYVGPDNGLFSAALAQPGAQVFVLDRLQYWLSDVSRTFHGRDIFAPVAAHLAHGVPAEDMGTPGEDALRLAIREPIRPAQDLIQGEVAYVDHFGNLITNIPGAWLAEGHWHCQVGGHTIHQFCTVYAKAPPGTLLTLVSSAGTVEIAQRSGSAAQTLGVTAGEPVTLRLAGLNSRPSD
jgi:S-adenosyl-L-methionine hydrolase (adenosine-forming)